MQIEHIQEKVILCREFKGKTIALQLEEAEYILSAIEGFKTALLTANNQLRTAIFEREGLNGELEQAQREQHRAEVCANSKNDLNQRLIERIEQLNNENKALREEVEGLKGEVTRLKDLDEWWREYSADYEWHIKEVERLKEEYERLEYAFIRTNDEKQELQSEVEIYRTALEQITSLIENANPGFASKSYSIARKSLEVSHENT